MGPSPHLAPSAHSGWPARGLIAWFVHNPVAANLLMLLLLIGGALTALTMKTEVFPTLQPRSVQISVFYPGATPEEVEEAITRRVEEAVLGLDGVDRVRSTASENRGTVTVELKNFADAQTVKDDVETAVSALADFPPADAEQPRIRVPQPLSTIVSFALTGNVGETALRDVGARIRRDLLAQDGISTVQLRGVREREISIAVSENDLRAYGLRFTEVADALQDASVDLSGGDIRTRAGEILLRTDARRETGAEFEDIILRASRTGARVRLGDVAVITDGFQQEPLISTFNGHPAVFVDVQTRGAEDLLSVRNAAVDFVETLRMPLGIEMELAVDNSQVFQDRLSLLARNAILGFTLVFILLVLVLDLRLAFWVAMGVPISFLGGFALFGAAGVTLNFITTFGLIVVLGIVVDDAIVVGENTDRERHKGRTGEEAAIAGVTGVAAPVLVGVLTTMAAFGPLIFSGGTFGEISRPIPIVVICILAISLVEAFFILPAHLAHGHAWSRGPLAAIQNRVARYLTAFAAGPVNNWAHRAARMRYLVAAAGIVILIALISLAATGVVRFIFFPSIEAEEITADISLPDGSPFSATRAAAEQMIAAAEALQAEYAGQNQPVIESIESTIGGRTSLFDGPGSSSVTTISSNLSQIIIRLTPASIRTLSSSELEALWRERTGDLPGVEQLSVVSSAGPQEADIAYELTHPDSEALEAAARRLAIGLAELDGVAEIRDGLDRGKRQLNFSITPAGEAAGLTSRTIARQVRQAFFGEEVQRIQRGSDEVRVYIRYPQEDRASLGDIDNLRIRTSDNQTLPLNVAATIHETRSFTRIERTDGRRTVEITADVNEALVTPNQIRQQVETTLLPELASTWPELRWELEGEGREQAEDFSSLSRGLLIALIVMYTLLATQLRSYIQPLIILIAIPFGIGGAILGHFLMGYALSFPSIFGMVALSGVVVNASIILIDRYNLNMAERGMRPADAIAEAASRRFRPILITTLTTVLGLLPIISEQSPQAQFLAPMVVSLGTGLLFASVAIVTLLPALVLIVDDVRNSPATRPVTVGGLVLGLILLAIFRPF